MVLRYCSLVLFMEMRSEEKRNTDKENEKGKKGRKSEKKKKLAKEKRRKVYLCLSIV